MPSLLTVAGTGLQGWVISFNSLQLVQQAQISVHMHVHLSTDSRGQVSPPSERVCKPRDILRVAGSVYLQMCK